MKERKKEKKGDEHFFSGKKERNQGPGRPRRKDLKKLNLKLDFFFPFVFFTSSKYTGVVGDAIDSNSRTIFENSGRRDGL